MTKRLVAQHIGFGSIIAVWLLLPERTWSIKKGSNAMPIFAQAALLLVLLLALPAAATAQNTATFEAPNGSYKFEYPQDFALDQLFADGGGDVTGVTASSPANGDVIITFLGPRDPGETKEVSEKTHQPIVDEFTNAIARLPSIKLQSSSMTTMLGQPAIDMIFLNKRFVYQGKGNPAVNRYVFTILNGKAYNFECIYREDKTEQFAPACDLAVSTVRLQDAAAAASSTVSVDDGDDGD
ncbi:hypothetical protein [Rhizobium sp. BR 314]|uniref:hypothetical protein n=1 Tax=Rhizobium sp. BR 314 TaxID=3040013 RepID=UPI0039BF1D8F